MTASSHRIASPPRRSLAIAALIGAALLAVPQTHARAESSRSPARDAETVEARITALHADLQITSAEETDWNGVAEAMRQNAAAMEKLGADRTEATPESLTAVGDLEAYEKFAQAHVDGLKNLIASFVTLYGTMPDPQKKIADEVFASFGHKSEGPAHG
jgi:hypothetical protein